MLKFGNKEFRNLQEQVEKNMKDILFILQEEGVLNEFGIKVIGQEDTAASMPTVADYKESNPDWAYGDAYAIGTKAPYTLYILTRANGTHPNDYWFNIGSFPVTGPQGPQGPQGEVGPQGQTGNAGPQGTSAGFGDVTATATSVEPTEEASASVVVSGPNTALNLDFSFEIPKGEKGDTAYAEWGNIDGSIDNQTDLVNALQLKQNASNAVTTDGTQTITGDKTFTNTNGIHIKGKVDFGTKVSGRTNTSYIATDNYDGIGFWVNGIRAVNVYDNATYFAKNILPNSTTVDIGDSTHPWKDIYLSGTAYIGSSDFNFSQFDTNTWILKKGTTNIMFGDTGNTYLETSLMPKAGTPTSDLGSTARHWKDLYLSGNIYLGTNATYIKSYTDNKIGIAVSGSEVAQFTRYNIYFNNQIRGIIAPQTNNNGNIGTSSLVYATTYTNKVSDGTNSISVANIASKNDLNFLSLDGGTMEGNIRTGGFGIPEKTILGDGLDIINDSSQANVTTHYGAGYIQQDDDENTSIRYEYNFPKKNGTIAISENLPSYTDISNFTCQNENFVMNSASGYAELKNNLLVINAVIIGTSDSTGQIYFNFTLPEALGTLIKPLFSDVVSQATGRIFNTKSAGVSPVFHLKKISNTTFTIRVPSSYDVKTYYSVNFNVLLW